MEVFGVIFAMVAVVASAPTLNEEQVRPNTEDTAEYYRDKRSQYAQYASPCPYAAAAASAPIPTYAPAYQVNVSPYQGYGYAAPHYKSAEMDPENEMLSFSSDHMPMARYGFVQPAAASSVHPSYAAPAYAAPAYAAPATVSGPVFSVFPGGNTGGCSVPLLLSCQPSIVSGHVVQSQANYGGDSYRSMDAASHHEPQDPHHDQQIHEHLSTTHDASHTIAAHQ